MSHKIDPVWEEKYSQGHAQRYPWDKIVSFVFGYRPREKTIAETAVLEVGCGTASNLWFAAREGFKVAGIEGSPSAIEYAKKRFHEEGLEGDLRVGDFTQLPFEDEAFDLAIDRGALVCAGFSAGQKAVDEIYRILKPGGKFHFNPYSDRHSSFTSGIDAGDGLRSDINEGTLVGAGQLCFYGKQDVLRALGDRWNILMFRHIEWSDQQNARCDIHAEWQVICEKK